MNDKEQIGHLKTSGTDARGTMSGSATGKVEPDPNAEPGRKEAEPAKKREMLTISLTDRPPVRIDKAKWGIIASAKDYDNEHEFQANRKWTLIVREHDDGRAIVYGIYDTHYATENNRRGGVLVEKGGDVAAAIKAVGAKLDFSEDLIQTCIADLPAEEI
jgi:hypothetical protein